VLLFYQLTLAGKEAGLGMSKHIIWKINDKMASAVSECGDRTLCICTLPRTLRRD
jgi:hypothetical protein